jgi:hypothetical protein
MMVQKAHLKRVKIPMLHSLKYMNNWSSLRSAAKNFLLPYIHNHTSARNYVFYRRQ